MNKNQPKHATPDPFDVSAVPEIDPFLVDLPRVHAETSRDTTARPGVHAPSSPRAITHLVYEVMAEQPALCHSFGGTPTHEETDVLDFAGRMRYWIKNAKVRGVTRRILSDMEEPGCEVTKPCEKCLVCSLFGHRGFTDDGRSRVALQDLWSLGANREHIESARCVQGSPLLRHASLIPVGTRFIGSLFVRTPSIEELSELFCALEAAFSEGIGARTTTLGSMRLRPLAMMGGAWTRFGSVSPLLERIDEAGETPEEATRWYLQRNSLGRPFIAGAAARECFDTLVRQSRMSPAYEEMSFHTD